MAQPCSICAYRRRKTIDRQLVSGVPIRRIAAQFGVSASALQRHKKHISDAVVEAVARDREQEAGSLAEELESMLKLARDNLHRAIREKNRLAIETWFKEYRSTWMLAVKMGIEGRRARERDGRRPVSPEVQAIIDDLVAWEDSAVKKELEAPADQPG